MKKFILSALIGVLAVNSYSASITTVVQPGTFTNLLTTFNQSTYVRQINISAPSTTNAAGLVIDTPTNALTFVNAAYTNSISYATNYNTTWTNFYGVVNTNPVPIVALIDVTNNVVPASTNSYPVKLGVAAGVGLSAQYQQFNQYFNKGIWFTNTGPGAATITVIY